MSAPPRGSVVCWRVGTDDLDEHTERRLLQLLDTSELERAERFRQPADRQRFVAGRGALRVLLAQALTCRPSAVELVAGPAGKPLLAGGELQFSVSHSGSIVLVAVSRDVPVGVDVERERTIPDHRDLADRFFHPDEARELRSLPDDAAEPAFLRCWCRKEAVAKAVGLGLSLALDSFRVAVLPEAPAAVVSAGPELPPAHTWSLFDLTPLPGYAGAVAFPTRSAKLVRSSLDLTRCVA